MSTADNIKAVVGLYRIMGVAYFHHSPRFSYQTVIAALASVQGISVEL